MGLASTAAEVQRQVLSRSRLLFSRLPKAAVQYWQRRAEVWRRRQVEQQAERCAGLRAQLRLLVARHEESQSAVGIPNDLDSCRLESQELQCLLETFNAVDGRTMQGLEHGALASPALPSPEQQAVLLQVAGRYQGRPPQCPWWARHFVLNRDLFRGAAICGEAREGGEAWMFLLALQRPLCAVFMRLTRRPRTLPAYECLGAGEVSGQPLHRLEFSWLPQTMACQDTVPLDEDGQLFIMHGLRFEGDTVFTNHLPVPFEEFVRSQPPFWRNRGTQGESRPKPVATRDDRARLLQEFPWLTEQDLDHACGFKRLASGKNRKAQQGDQEAPQGGSEAEDSGAEQVPREIDEAEVLEELAGIRAEYEEEGDDDAGFQLEILGGRWTARHVGISADRVAVLARGEAARIWCADYQWPKMTSFSFNRYTQAGAVELAREVLRRANYFFRQWLYAEETEYKYTDAVIAGYSEELEWVTWMAAQETNSVTLERAMVVRRMVPRSSE